MADGDLWRDRNKVFVAGLPLHADDDALYEKFKPFGEMHQSKVVYDQKSGRSRGFGFVTFCEYTDALDAVDQLNQSKWEKRTLNVRFLQPKNGSDANGAAAVVKRPTKAIGPRPEGCTTVYVGNLAYDITEEVLRKVFDKCGSIRAVRFAEHIQTKEFRGFGYVQFHEEGPCEEAIKLDGMVVMGRPMNIDYGARDEGYAQAREELQKKLKKGICHKFQQGQCTRGDACKFAHVMQDQDAEELVQPAERPVNGIATPGASLGAAEPESSGPVVEPTQATSDAPVCINFQKGKCKRGAGCKFQHLVGNSEESGTMDSDNVEMEAEAEAVEEVPEEEETRADEGAPVCQNYQKGKCKRGAACRFRHVAAPAGGYQEPEEESWKAPVRVALPVAAVAEVAVCRNFQRGTCMRGASCRFAHTGQESQAAPSSAVEEVSEYQKRFQSVCYNWQNSGSCVRGGNCPFQHDGAPTREQEEQSEKKERKHKNDPEEEEDNSKKHKKHKKDKKRKEEAEEEEGNSKKHKKHKKDKKRKHQEEGSDEEDTKKKHKKHKKHKKSKDVESD
ncbi:Protein gar2 [Phytophthora citrophthora]|uniref:Protein gar2 n=1 Tax=Phytophthora citrophthora TaxID=4793 RepID=A0AAD9GSN3_9STRA|nr:Protein gar2 [Phytophthora citrophthora]